MILEYIPYRGYIEMMKKREASFETNTPKTSFKNLQREAFRERRYPIYTDTVFSHIYIGSK